MSDFENSKNKSSGLHSDDNRQSVDQGFGLTINSGGASKKSERKGAIVDLDASLESEVLDKKNDQAGAGKVHGLRSEIQENEEKIEKRLDSNENFSGSRAYDMGSAILDKIKSIREAENDGVIYGIYDSKEQGLFTRVNDFFIDHSKVKIKDKVFFFHMLAVMVDAGIPVVQAVKSIAGRLRNRKFMRVLNTVAYNTEHGLTLSDAMSRFDDVFDESEIGIVKSGEATGRLDRMLFKLSERLDSRNDLTTKLWGAAIYPIAVLVVLVLVAVGMLVWVFPTLLELLTEGGQEVELPAATKVLIFLQEGIVNYWHLIGLGILLIYGAFVLYVSTEFGRQRWDYFKLRVPIMGEMLRKLFVLRFVDMMGLLIDAGVPVINALTITGNSLQNRVYKLKTQEIIEGVKTGGKISVNMGDSEFLFPPEVVQMINVGETTANLGPISEKIAVQYTKELDNALKRLTSVFEPFMILFVGLFVALLALAIMSPIFNLGTVVS